MLESRIPDLYRTTYGISEHNLSLSPEVVCDTCFRLTQITDQMLDDGAMNDHLGSRKPDFTVHASNRLRYMQQYPQAPVGSLLHSVEVIVRKDQSLQNLRRRDEVWEMEMIQGMRDMMAEFR